MEGKKGKGYIVGTACEIGHMVSLSYAMVAEMKEESRSRRFSNGSWLNMSYGLVFYDFVECPLVLVSTTVAPVKV